MVKKGTDTQVDKAGIEHLLKNHGILLEHRVYNFMMKYFAMAYDVEILFNRVGDKIPYLQREEPIETDVCFFVKKHHQAENLLLKTSRSEKAFPDRIPKYSIVNYFIIQCKGHPHNGFLLCRDTEDTREQKEILSYSGGDHGIVMYPDTVFYVDWAHFFKKSEKPKDGEVYREDKGKFYKGLSQINRSLAAYKSDNVEGKYSENSYTRFIPMIITDCPLYNMQIGRASVIIGKAPWVRFVQEENGESSYVYVLCFSYLEAFLNMIINKKQLSYPDGTLDRIHTFGI
jgi:hypothetical protein